jgi:hypothetical protein
MGLGKYGDKLNLKTHFLEAINAPQIISRMPKTPIQIDG